MPNTKSARKSLRSSDRKRKNNLVYKNKIKDLVKKVNVLVTEGKKEEAKKMLSAIYKALDKAAKVNVIKKNTASRKKSRLTNLVDPKLQK